MNVNVSIARKQTADASVGNRLTLLYPSCTLVAVHEMYFDMLCPHCYDLGVVELMSSVLQEVR